MKTAPDRSGACLLYTSVAATPPSAQILTNQGMLLRRLGRQADARASYEAALRLQPGYSRAAAELASLRR